MHTKDDIENRTGAPTPLRSRRKFIGAAVATGGAGILSAELTVLSARGNADTAAQIVLPAATKDVTPFKVHVPQQVRERCLGVCLHPRDAAADTGVWSGRLASRAGDVDLREASRMV